MCQPPPSRCAVLAFWHVEMKCPLPASTGHRHCLGSLCNGAEFHGADKTSCGRVYLPLSRTPTPTLVGSEDGHSAPSRSSFVFFVLVHPDPSLLANVEASVSPQLSHSHVDLAVDDIGESPPFAQTPLRSLCLRYSSNPCENE